MAALSYKETKQNRNEYFLSVNIYTLQAKYNERNRVREKQRERERMLRWKSVARDLEKEMREHREQVIYLFF